ncbi:MAG: hypothetical protein ACPK85_09050 [Methanosarcina sp.]
MKCPICGMERTEIEERKRLFDKEVNRKDRLAPVYVILFTIIFRYYNKTSSQLVFVFMILIIVYWMLLSKISYSSASTITGKRRLMTLNICGVIVSFVFSYAAMMYIISLFNPSYSVSFLYFWSGVFVLGFVLSNSLVFSKKKLNVLEGC